ncbi:MAG: TonB-dependent receptor [Gammaproteobacteria bacterium]|nr:TonB-dependent receptor [Gammaproteobacteria bacterium]
MYKYLASAGGVVVALALNLLFNPAQQVLAQEAEEIEEVVVTGSRIRRNPLDEPVAIMDISAQDLQNTGLTNLGDALQNLPITGSAINSQFNVPGNSGFPQDGSGIGAGAAEVSIRNVGAKRTLVLIDGRRWIAGASASGVPSAVDLNTVPDNVIERVEVLQDGASAIYGSDAIGGVINIITKQDFEGFQLAAQTGGYLSDNDGESLEISGLWGGGNDTTHFVFSASYKDEQGIETANRGRSAFPNPDATSCDVPGSNCSSFTPQGRFILGPDFGLYRNGVPDASCTSDDEDCGTPSITLNNGVLNDGMANIPVFDPNDLNAGDFHQFTNADRFNYNGPGFNFLRTPNERVNFYLNVRHDLADNVTLFARASYTNRSSATKAAPEPLCFFDCGNAIADATVISALNPFNPFGVDLSVADGTAIFFGRRPLESGGRLFFQDVNTYMYAMGLEGEFSAGGRDYYWDLSAGYGDNRGFQEKFNSHNQAKLQVALGDPAICAGTPNCVPFNLFGGQGPDGNGSFTQEMLDFVTYTQRDFSEQTLRNYAFNIGGNIAEMPAGNLGFAAGLEYRDHEGAFRPDPIAERGETAGIPSGSTSGEFDVTEIYGEVNVPLLSNARGAEYVELNLAVRSSDYSTFGSESTYKASGLWRVYEDLSMRASFSTGFRAPGIGELFGGAAREDFTFQDPCTDYTGALGADNNGRDDPQPANIQANCATLGVSPGQAQVNPQFSAISAGNASLTPEESDNWTAGFVFSPAWAGGQDWSESITMSLDFYNLEIDNAIQGNDPGDLVDGCVETLDPTICALVPRSAAGQLGLINNQLQNIGRIEASGWDLMIDYLSPETDWGQFTAKLNATGLTDYEEQTTGPDGSVSVNDLKGRHTDETFARAFPELRTVTTIGWARDRWNGSLAFRWVDDMSIVTSDGVNDLDSAMFTDLRASYRPPILDDALLVTLGFNNVFDEDPPVCSPCGVIGLSTVAHDLPGRVGYLRVTYER